MQKTDLLPLDSIRLTQYSHGAGCGCKISPSVLSEILRSNLVMPGENRLLVGNHTRDDAAVYDLGGGEALISTTDFFMPIVDDPFDFGKIASANAISDVYAMGGRPILAIAILGWPVNKLPAEMAARVIDGARVMCMEAGIPLAGGHSIDSPEPIFGLAVNGLVRKEGIKTNAGAKEGDLIYLTKALGVGILTTAEKKGLLKKNHMGLAARQMMKLNNFGSILAAIPAVHALTDVTGFGLMGHLVEMCEGSGLSAVIELNSLPLICTDLDDYIQKACIPGGTHRNWASYGEKVSPFKHYSPERAIGIVADPQTSGGLLVAVDPGEKEAFESLLKENKLSEFARPVGFFTRRNAFCVELT